MFIIFMVVSLVSLRPQLARDVWCLWWRAGDALRTAGIGVRGVIPSFGIGKKCTLVGSPLAYTTKVALSPYTEPLRAGEWLHPAYPTLWLYGSIVSSPEAPLFQTTWPPRRQPRGGVYEWPTADIPRARLCTREYTVVYTWVYNSVHACTHSPPRQEVYTG